MKFYSAVGLLLIGGILMIHPAVAQKKKKSNVSETPQRDNIKYREAEFYFTEGEKYFILEDYAKALLYFQKSLEVNAENATVHYKIAEVLSRSDKQDDLMRASLSIENALKLEKKNKYFYLLAASIYNSMARFDKSAEMYETMISEIKGTEEHLYDLAAIYQYSRKPENAIKTYNKAESIFGVNEVSSVQKISLYLEAGKIKEAINEGEKLLDAFPGDERYAMAFAEVLSKNGQQSLAISNLEKFVEQNEDASNARMLLAGFYRDTQQEEKARKLLTYVFDDPSVELGSKIIVLGAYNTELNYNRSKNIKDESKEAFVVSLYEKLVKDYPQEPNVHVLGGDLYLSTGNDYDAINEYQVAIKLGDVNYEVWQNLLFLEMKVNQFDNVIRHTDQALELFPNQAMLYYFNGFAHLRKQQYDEAVAALEQAKKLSGSNNRLLADINGMLGDTYYSLKQFAKSDQAYEEALALNPENDVILNNYSYYLSLRKENLEKAEKMSTQLIKNNPDNPTYLDTHAWVLYVRGKYKEAKKFMERAILSGQANAVHFEHYGDILFKLGDINGAVQQWEKAKETDANNEMLNRKIANRKIYE